MICVHDFPRGEVSVKVGVMEFGLYSTNTKLQIQLDIISKCYFN